MLTLEKKTTCLKDLQLLLGGRKKQQSKPNAIRRRNIVKIEAEIHAREKCREVVKPAFRQHQQNKGGWQQKGRGQIENKK